MPSHYRIFLLTVWRDDSAAVEDAALRFSIQDPRSSQRRGFSDLKGLGAFLEGCLDAAEVVSIGDSDESTKQGGSDR